LVFLTSTVLAAADESMFFQIAFHGGPVTVICSIIIVMCNNKNFCEHAEEFLRKLLSVSTGERFLWKYAAVWAHALGKILQPSPTPIKLRDVDVNGRQNVSLSVVPTCVGRRACRGSEALNSLVSCVIHNHVWYILSCRNDTITGENPGAYGTLDRKVPNFRSFDLFPGCGFQIEWTYRNFLFTPRCYVTIWCVL
jgi:hypothetical protein